MSIYQTIRINNIEYNIVDSIQDFRAEDSFIHRSNKLAQYEGNGESKKHIGTYSGELGQKNSSFFEYSNWGVNHFDTEKKRKSIFSARQAGAIIQENTCFFSKSNLLKYLEDARAEYFAQEQVYHNDISQYFEERLCEVQNLSSELNYFTIYDASDNLTERQNRGYIRSDDRIWKLWRSLILPKISYLSILKLIPINPTSENNYPIFYFRILLDYQFRSFVHPSASQVVSHLQLKVKEKPLDRKASRRGQAKYKKEVHEHMPACPFTKITDERLLVASHIKPYKVCMDEGREDQALDYLNGLTLSPTYDTLFDEGFITFTNDGRLICGTLISSYNWAKLNINPNAKNKMNIYPENRELYLEHHRKYVFQDNVDDLI
jgi:putative restriction endonuclease